VTRAESKATGAAPDNAPASIVVGQLAFIGDMVFATPLLDALRERWPSATIVVVGRPPALEVLADHPAVDRRVPYDKRGRHRGARGLLGLAGQLRDLRPDWFLAVSRSARTALLARLSGAALRIGFEGPARRLAYHRVVPRLDEQTTFTERPNRLLLGLGLAPAARPMHLEVGEARREEARRRLEEAGWRGEPLLAIAPGAHYATKCWPEEHVAGLLDRLADRGDLRPALVGGPGEHALIGRLLDGRPGVLDRRGLGVGDMAAEITLARAFLGGDSGPSHIARALGVPTLVLHGPTPHEPLWDGRPYHYLSRGLDCQPCSASGDPECPLGHHRCMREITPDQVLARLEELILQQGRHR
jgi:heptosyltransferase-2